MQELTYTNEADWHAIRNGYVGSSESAALLGITTWCTAFSLYHAKRGRVRMTAPDNNRLDAGKRLEHAIATWFADREGLEILRSQVYAVADDADRMGSTCDYFVTDKTDPAKGPGILEIKNRDWFQWKEHWTDKKPPADVACQVQHQFRCTRFTWGMVGCLVGGNDLRRYDVRPSTKAMDHIVDLVEGFWAMVDTNVEPPVEGYPCDIDTLKDLYATVVRRDVNVDDTEVAETVRMWEWAREQRLQMSKTEDSCKAKVMQVMRDADVLYAPTVRVNQSIDSRGARRFTIKTDLPDTSEAKQSMLEAG